MTRKIARNKSRNLEATAKRGKTKKPMGRASRLTPAMNSPRNNPIEYSRMDEEEKRKRVAQNIVEYNRRERRNRKKIGKKARKQMG